MQTYLRKLRSIGIPPSDSGNCADVLNFIVLLFITTRHSFSTDSGPLMRIFASAALVAVLSLGTPAVVAAQDASARTANALARPGAKFKDVQVIDVRQLPDIVKPHVEEMVSQTTPDELQALRKSIDGTPAAVSALKGKSLTSPQVVAADISDGLLTIFVKAAN